MSAKRSWKLQEFVAHAGAVNCLALGHKSGRVMVTGGEDRKVNMWAVGKPNCIMSLQGHTSAVESVRFGNSEEMVVAGSASGALKIWDLEQAKIVRTLTGHRANVRSLDFHPYGDFVASGAMDNNVKLWDIRRKGCIFTYKGHGGCINCLRFSPDGRWIVSASDDGTVKLWDLTAGRQIADLQQHTGPVNSVEFHPNEFLLASASSDRTVKFWDLETFHMVCSTDGESGAVRAIAFHPDGSCIYSGGQDSLKAYGWEPSRLYDSLTTGWGKVMDFATAQNQLIGASFMGTNVSTYVVDLQRVQPHGAAPDLPAAQSQRSAAGDGQAVSQLKAAPDLVSPPKTSSARRHTFERPPTQSSTRQQSQYREEQEEEAGPGEDPGDDAVSVASIENPVDYRAIFKPKKSLARSPSRQPSPFLPPDDDEKPPEPKPSALAVGERKGSGDAKTRQPAAAAASQAEPRRQHSNSRARDPPQPREKERAPPAAAAASEPETRRSRAPRARDQQAKPAPAPATARDKSDIDPQDFMAKPSAPVLPSGGETKDLSESEAVSNIMKGHSSMAAVLASRNKNLQIVRALWSSQSVRVALDSAINMQDQAVLVDVLNVINQKTTLWSLEISAMLLPHIKGLLASKYDSYMQTGCASVKLVLRQFGQIIKGHLQGPPPIGVDISREERASKCRACYGELQVIRGLLDAKTNARGTVASVFREIRLMLDNIEP